MDTIAKGGYCLSCATIIASIHGIILLSMAPFLLASAQSTDRQLVWIEKQNADDAINTLEIYYYNDRSCVISHKSMGRSQIGWVCDNSTNEGGSCIYRAYLCDGMDNCPKGQDEDEAFCAARQCEADKGEDFRCPSGRCLRSSLRCNGRPDCPFSGLKKDIAYDELFCGCSIHKARLVTANYRNSPRGEKSEEDLEDGYLCRTVGSRECIAKSLWCDGKIDCSGGDDENAAICAAKPFVLFSNQSYNAYSQKPRTSTTHRPKTTETPKQTTPRARTTRVIPTTTKHTTTTTEPTMTTPTDDIVLTSTSTVAATTTTTDESLSTSITDVQIDRQETTPSAYYAPFTTLAPPTTVFYSSSDTPIAMIITSTQPTTDFAPVSQSTGETKEANEAAAISSTAMPSTPTDRLNDIASSGRVTSLSDTSTASPSPDQHSSSTTAAITTQRSSISSSLSPPSSRPDASPRPTHSSAIFSSLSTSSSSSLLLSKLITTTKAITSVTANGLVIDATLTTVQRKNMADSTSSVRYATLDGFETLSSDYDTLIKDDDDSTTPFSKLALSENQSSNEDETSSATANIEHPGGAGRQRDEDMVVYIAIGTIAAAVFVGGLIFLIILNVRRSAAMAARKEKLGDRGAYSTVPTSALFSKQATSDQSSLKPNNNNNNNGKKHNNNNTSGQQTHTNERRNYGNDATKNDQTDLAVRQSLLSPERNRTSPTPPPSATARL